MGDTHIEAEQEIENFTIPLPHTLIYIYSTKSIFNTFTSVDTYQPCINYSIETVPLALNTNYIINIPT